jgi:hypothetical protein
LGARQGLDDLAGAFLALVVFLVVVVFLTEAVVLEATAFLLDVFLAVEVVFLGAACSIAAAAADKTTMNRSSWRDLQIKLSLST